MTTLYNANPRSAYRAGFYTGTHPVGELLRHGDFGLGALDGNDGELVVLDGRAYRTAYDGTTHELDAAHTTPCAAVQPFVTTRSTELSGLGATDFERAVGEWLPLRNRIWALRVHGRFSLVDAGAGVREQPPYRPMSQVMPEYNRLQHINATGTLVGLACPDFMLGISRVGFHYHWLSDDRTQGGHVFDFALDTVTVDAAEATAFTVDVAADDSLHALDLTPTN